MPASSQPTLPDDAAAPDRGRPIWLAIWCVFLAAFVVLGVIGLRPLGRRVRVVAPSSRSSTDTVLLAQLGVPQGSARIAACLAEIPESQPITIVYRDQARTMLAALQFGTLAWPRPTHLIELLPDEPSSRQKLEAAGARPPIFFVGTSRPPDWPDTASLSPLLHFHLGPPAGGVPATRP